MTETVGSVSVEVRADLAPYNRGLEQARQLAQQFSGAAGTSMKTLQGETQRVRTEVERYNKSQGLVNIAIQQFSGALSAARSQAQGMLGLLPTLAGVGGLAGVYIAANQAVQAFGAWEQQQIQFEGRLRATRGALGLTAEDITALSKAISRDTLVPAENLRNIAIQMGATGEITEGSLERALRLLPDLALRTGDLTSATQALTASLRNPTEAYMRLRDAGVQFTQSQRETLDNMNLFQDRLQGAATVLDILEGQIGGEAAARGAGVTGGFSFLAQQVSELTINLGGAINRLLGFSDGARRVGSALSQLNQDMFPQSYADQIATVTRELEGLKQQLEEIKRLSESAPSVTGSGFLDALVGGATGMPGGGALPSQAMTEQAIAAAQARRELLGLGQAYSTADQAQVRATRALEQYDQRLNDHTKSLRDQLSAMEGRNRAQMRAFQMADQLGVSRDDPQVAQWTRLNEQIEARRRALAQAGQQTIFERENERLERQIELFQYGNQEMRIREQLMQIELRAMRARQPLTEQQKQELETNLRLLERTRQLTSTIESAFESVFSNLTSAVSEFAVTGKFDFKAFADSVVRDLVRIAMQAFVTKPLMQAITGLINPMVSASVGGTTAATAAAMPAPTLGFAEGGSFRVPGSGSGDKPALLVGLTPGERVDVTPVSQATRGRGSGGGVTVINNVNSSREFESTTTEREGPDGTRIVETVFSEVMKRVGRGDADQTFGARFGVRPRTIQR